MSAEQKIYESQLYEIWKDKKYSKELKTISGDEVAILDAGIQDLDSSGPDFKNARIRIGNLTYVGDIEIDGDYRDWKHHGHNIDIKYNKVVLHASLLNKFNQPYVYTKEGRKVPTICLDRFVDSSLLNNLKKEPPAPKDNGTLKCQPAIGDVDLEIREKMLLELGVGRFKKKCKKIHERIKELIYLKEMNVKEPVVHYDFPEGFEEKVFSNKDFENKEIWEQVFYELVFEALGYSKNKNIMFNLAKSANIEFISKLKKEDGFLGLIESALFGIGGILPREGTIDREKVPAYVAQIYKNWDLIKKIYDGKTYEETDWQFFKLRPQNFPTVRLAAGSRFLYQIINSNLIGKISKKILEIRNLTVLINSLRSLFVIKSEGFWSQHYVFNKPSESEIKYFVGAARADEIVVNVVLPFFAVYYEVFDDERANKKVYKLYTMYNQRSDNRIVRDVADCLLMSDQVKRTVYSQGMIELFRSYCSKNKCLECSIGKSVFG